jgi:hypothetical protein
MAAKNMDFVQSLLLDGILKFFKWGLCNLKYAEMHDKMIE